VTIDLGIILAFVCVLISAASFFCGRSVLKGKEVKDLKADCKAQGEKEGRIEAKIDGLTLSMARLEGALIDYRKEFNGKIADVNRRIDRHIADGHGNGNG